jgi:hypothetical protein
VPLRCPRCGNVFHAPAAGSAALAETALPADPPRRSRAQGPLPPALSAGDRDFRLRPAPARRGVLLLVAVLLVGALGSGSACCLGVAGLGWGYYQPAAGGPDPGPGPDAIVAEPGTWTVLFRADDPAVWDSDSPGKQFAIPLRKAPATVHYLRLRRMDTSAALILPVKRAQLGTDEIPGPRQKHVWNGTAKLEWSGRHLGIVQGQRFPFPAPDGMITVFDNAQ